MQWRIQDFEKGQTLFSGGGVEGGRILFGRRRAEFEGLTIGRASAHPHTLMGWAPCRLLIQALFIIAAYFYNRSYYLNAKISPERLHENFKIRPMDTSPLALTVQ